MKLTKLLLIIVSNAKMNRTSVRSKTAKVIEGFDNFKKILMLSI